MEVQEILRSMPILLTTATMLAPAGVRDARTLAEKGSNNLPSGRQSRS
jgi:hypothetical protein